MPANVETMMSVRETPWHGEGVVLSSYPKTIDEAIVAAGLDWQVQQIPVQVRVGGKLHKAPGVLANVRVRPGMGEDGADEVSLLGVVTTKYKPIQNRDAFSWLANLYGSEMNFETAGALHGGKRVWVLMKLPEYIEVAGDEFVQYSFVSNSHDGKSSVLSACTPIRIVCQNTLNAAVGRAQRTYTIRHMGDMSTKIAEARNVLGVTVNYYEQFKALGDKLGTVKFSDKRAKETLEHILLINDAQGERAARNVEEARKTVMDIFKSGQAQGMEYGDLDDGSNRGLYDTRGNCAGTAWGLYNAVTEYADWGRSARKSRWRRAVDDTDGMKSRAFNVIAENAGVTV